MGWAGLIFAVCAGQAQVAQAVYQRRMHDAGVIDQDRLTGPALVLDDAPVLDGGNLFQVVKVFGRHRVLHKRFESNKPYLLPLVYKPRIALIQSRQARSSADTSRRRATASAV